MPAPRASRSIRVPDERHVRRADVPAIAALLAPMRPRIELNIEGYPDERLLEIVRETRPEQCTLVPDAPDAFTSEKGWELDPAADAAGAAGHRGAEGARCAGGPVHRPRSRRARSGGRWQAPRGWNSTPVPTPPRFRAGDHAALLDACAETARQAHGRGLAVNAGHDLNLHNLPPLVARLPALAEASIGHELTADALEMGFAATVRAYAAALMPG